MFAIPDQPPTPPAIVAQAKPAPANQAQPAPTGADKAAQSTAQAPPLRIDSHGYHYVVRGNHLLTQAAVRTAITGGKTPKAAMGALKHAYEQAGYFLIALVGKRQGQNVLFQVVQGRLTHVEGPSGLTAYFESLKGDDRIRASDIIRQSSLAQAYAATNGEKPQLSFHPAPEIGGSVLQVTTKPIKHSRPVGGSLTAGNYGNRYAGHFLAQAQVWGHYNGMTLQLGHTRAMTGMDENTQGAYYAANSATLSMVTPIGLFELDGRTTHYRLGAAFAPLYPGGKIKMYGGSATQLLYADAQRRWTLKEGLHYIHDTGTVFSGSYVLRDQRYYVLDLSSDASWRFAGLFDKASSLSLAVGTQIGLSRADAGFASLPGRPTGHFQIGSSLNRVGDLALSNERQAAVPADSGDPVALARGIGGRVG